MPIYTAPGHPDCHIKCEGAGSAVYVDPPGVCLRNCGDSLAAMLVRAVGSSLPDGSEPSLGMYEPVHTFFLSMAGCTTGAQLRRLPEEFNHLFLDRFRPRKPPSNEFFLYQLFGDYSDVIYVLNGRDGRDGRDGSAVYSFEYAGSSDSLSDGIAKSLNVYWRESDSDD